MKIHFVIDNTKCQKGPKLREYLKGTQNRIELHLIPPYRPKFNAVEYLWKQNKKATTPHRYVAHLEEV